MRQLLLLVTLLTAGLSTLSAQRIPKVEVYFQRHYTQQDLRNIQEELSVMGVRIEYDRVEFDSEGRLLGLGIAVDCNDGFSGRAYARPVPEGNKFGFVRDYRQQAKTPFLIGHLDKTDQ